MTKIGRAFSGGQVQSRRVQHRISSQIQPAVMCLGSNPCLSPGTLAPLLSSVLGRVEVRRWNFGGSFFAGIEFCLSPRPPGDVTPKNLVFDDFPVQTIRITNTVASQYNR